MSEEASASQIDLVSDIVSAYVSKNNVPVGELPALIQSVHASLGQLGKPAEVPAEDHRVRPAQIKKSITPDALISFLDGRPYKSLKRHLSSKGMTPEEYRTKFGLGPKYPMVAESYAAQRSELAKSLGLGQIRRDRAAEKRAAADAKVSAEPKRGRGRPKKAAAE